MPLNVEEVYLAQLFGAVTLGENGLGLENLDGTPVLDPRPEALLAQLRRHCLRVNQDRIVVTGLRLTNATIARLRFRTQWYTGAAPSYNLHGDYFVTPLDILKRNVALTVALQ